MFGSQLPTVEIDDVAAALSAGRVVLDVREDEEWQAGHIAGAVHVPMHEVPARVAEFTRSDEPLLVICKVGGRSAQVTAWLRAQGHDASNVEGGMLAWAVAHRPMVSEDGSTPYIA